MNESEVVVALITLDPSVRLSGVEGATAEVRRVAWSVNEASLSPEELRASIERAGAVTAAMAADVPLELALATARLLDEELQPTGVVLLRAPDADTWREAARAGVREIVDPNANGEVRRAVLAETARVERVRSVRAEQVSGVPPEHGRIIVVLSPKGGSGKTMVATNLGAALAASLHGGVALVDLDCVFGDVASVLGLVPERTIGQLAMLPNIDSTVIKVFLTPHHRSGLHVLAGSGLPEEGEAVTPSIAANVLTTLARDVPYVIVDTAAGLDERALAAVDVATDLVLLASLDVASIRNLGKEIDALDRIGATRARRHFVLNRADARVGLEVSDVENALGMKVTGTLPSSRSVPLSMNQGRTVVLDEPDTPVARELVALARLFVPTHDVLPSTDRKTKIFRRR